MSARMEQARTIWRALVERIGSRQPFDTYLDQVPEVPPLLRMPDPRWPYLVLVDLRVQVRELCRLAGISFAGTNVSLEHRAATSREPSGPFWIRLRRVAGMPPSTDGQIRPDEVHATAPEGAFFLLHRPAYFDGPGVGPILVVGGSTWPNHPDRPAYFKRWSYSQRDQALTRPSGGPPISYEIGLHLPSPDARIQGAAKLVRRRDLGI